MYSYKNKEFKSSSPALVSDFNNLLQYFYDDIGHPFFFYAESVTFPIDVKHLFLFVYGFSSHSRILHSYTCRDVIIAGEGLHILTSAVFNKESAIASVIKSNEFLFLHRGSAYKHFLNWTQHCARRSRPLSSVTHLLWHGASVYNSRLRGPVKLAPIAERLGLKLSLPVFTT